MKIAVVGAGSIGLLLGTFFSEMKFEVTMIVRRKEQSNLLNAQGIRRINIDQTETVCKVSATTNLKDLTSADIIIIAIKYADVQGLLAQFEAFDIQQPVCFVQNGIGHYELALATSLPSIVFGTIEHGAFKTDDRTVIHNGIGYLTMGSARGNHDALKEIKQKQADNFPVKILEDVEQLLMRKVLINCMINPLTAILQVKNGVLLTDSYCRSLFMSLYEELSAAFPMMKRSLSLDEVITVCDNTKQNQSSMLTDRLASRPMEIETIVSAVIKKAENAHKKLPILTILEKMLYAIDGKGEASC